MKKIRWQLIIIFLTGLVVGILLFTEQGGSRSSEPEPTQGGTYTEALIGSLQRLNPVLDFYNSVDRDVDRLIFSSLLKFDDRGLPVGDLAENWGISVDGLVYNVYLRDGVTWHDGQPVTSADVAFTIDLMRNGGTIVPQDVQDFWNSVEVTAGDKIIQFRLTEPFSPFLDYLSFGILPQHLLAGKTIDDLVSDNFSLAPVGSGPYKFDSLMVENGQITGVVLAAYEGYLPEPAYVEKIVFRYYADSASALQAYREGLVQGISYVSPDVLLDVMNEPDLMKYTGRESYLSLVLFNLNNQETPFLGDEDVRRALYMGINRQGMVDTVLQGQGILATGPIFPGTWAYYDGTAAINYEPENARSLLASAGYVLASEDATIRTKDDQELHFTLLYPDDEEHRKLAEYIQSNWLSLNVAVDLEAVPYDQLISERLDARNYQAALVDLNFTGTPDPDPYPFWDQGQATGGQNYTQWNNRIVSEYLEDARQTTDITERTRMYRNFQVVFANELPALPLYYPVYTYAVDKNVQGVSMGPLFDSTDRFATVTRWFLQTSKGSTADETPTP